MTSGQINKIFLVFDTCTYIATYRNVLYKKPRHLCTFSTFWEGFYTRQAYLQDRLMCSSCVIISSIHSAEHTCRNSTSVCSIHDLINLIKSCFCKLQLLFESGFYSRAAFMEDFTVPYRYLHIYCHTLYPTDRHSDEWLAFYFCQESDCTSKYG